MDTEPPEVKLTAPLQRSSDATPSFSGTSSESGVITVSVYAGSEAKGTPVIAKGEVKEGQWVTGAVAELKNGTYTAVASGAKRDRQRTGRQQGSNLRSRKRGPDNRNQRA